MTLQTFSIIIFLCIIFYALGKQLDKPILVIFGGLGIFLSGVLMLLTPMINLTGLANQVLGFILFGLGAYVWVTETTMMIWPDEKEDED
jgi:hypothetical protein